MLEHLSAHGFRTLVQSSVVFTPLTIMIGKNGVGKTTILNVIELLGKFARGGPSRAFGPPPWSLGWQRTKGFGQISTVDFDLRLAEPSGATYSYLLRLDERDGKPKVQEERLTRNNDNTVVASYDFRRPNTSGTILRPDDGSTNSKEILRVSNLIQSFESYELNPTNIERGNDPKHTYVTRDGFGVAAYLADLKDNDQKRFNLIESRLKTLRPETQSIEVWQPSDDVFWGLKDKGQQYQFSAVHLSWGERQLVGLLCILYSAKPHSTIAIEEIDRGFHPSRYAQVVELIKQVAYEGAINKNTVQVIATTHNPSFVNKLDDSVDNIRLLTRTWNSGTTVRQLRDVLQEKLGTSTPDRPLGEVWETGVLEDTLNEAME
jgi:predicted ATPase